MQKNEWKTKLASKFNEKSNLYDIYFINGAGDKEYLMSGRYNKAVLGLLSEDGVRIGAVKANKSRAYITACFTQHENRPKRSKRSRNRSRTVENTINHILAVCNDYIKYNA